MSMQKKVVVETEKLNTHKFLLFRIEKNHGKHLFIDGETDKKL